MARFHGMVGFSVAYEDRPGIVVETYTERAYKGDVHRRSYRWSPGEHLNDDLSVDNEISIISDFYSRSHFGAIRYVRWMDQTFEVTSASIDTDTHRISLVLGGVFNVPDTESDTDS